MKTEAKMAGTIAVLGAAAGAGLALGFGLRVFSIIALAGLTAGVALGALSVGKPHAEAEDDAEAPAAAI